MKPATRSTFAIVMVCFLISGIAGLVYQVAWARYLAIFLGHTSYAVIAVLVAFMGGLALGNAWFGVRADQSSKPLKLYGWLEIWIGIYAILFPFYFTFCHDAFIGLAKLTNSGHASLLVLRFLFSFATIIVPTFLMGATFPVLTKFVTRSLAELREKVAALYCINSAGAVLGAIIADFWWVPSFGLEMTVFGGAVLNLLAGALALYLSRQLDEEKNTAPAPAPAEPKTVELYGGQELRLAVIGIGLSGFVAMLYEVAWTRFLALTLGSSTHAFSLMLITFITGIAVGAWIIYRWKNLTETLKAFAWAELALAITLFISMFFYGDVPFWFLKLSSLLARQPAAYPVYELLQGLICFSVMFIPAVCLGMTLPLASRIATAELARTGRSVGKIFAVNTLGTVLGAIVTGLWLMPWLGLARTLAVGIVINALIGIVILARHRFTRRWAALTPIIGIGFVWFIGLLFHDNWQRSLSLGAWRNAQIPSNLQEYHAIANDGKVLYHKDGAGSTVMMLERKDGDKTVLALKVNGKTDASTAGDVTTQRLCGHLPMLLRPQSQQVLVVGMGSGMTAAAVARHSSIQHVDMVEISPEVVEVSRFFGDSNDRVHENPRVHIAIEDAKSFLKMSDKQYDLIISEPSNPWMAGVAGVFSREYYESCQTRLKPDGLMAQWVQIYETDDETLNLVLQTFSSVFPYLSIWTSARSADLILVGSAQPYKVDLEAMQKRFDEPSVRADMERTEIAALPVILACEVVSQQNGAFVAPVDGLIHSDFFPVLEYRAQKAFFARGGAGFERHNENQLSRPTTLLADYLKQHSITENDYKALGRFYLEYSLPKPEIFRSMLIRWQQEKPEATLPMELMSRASEGVVTAELEALRLAPKLDFLMKLAAQDPEPLRQYASYLIQTHRSQRSVFYVPPDQVLQKVLERLIETHPANLRVYRMQQAELAWDRGEDALCLELGSKALDPDIAKGGKVNFGIDPKAPRYVLHRMIESLWRAGKLAEAWNLSQQARQQRFTGSDIMLDRTCRKVNGYMTQSGVSE